MPHNALRFPATDPTPIFEHFRGNQGSDLLTAAVAHFDLFASLDRTPCSLDDLAQRLSLAPRPTHVLVTALRAMGLLREIDGRLQLTELAREHLVPGSDFDCGDYLGLAAQSPSVLQMVQLLKTNRPLGSDASDGGAAFIYRDGIASAMEATDTARHFTLALAGRAKNVAPALAEVAGLADATHLLDIGGGTGIYAFALLQKHPPLQATLFDRPEVLRVAQEMSERYGVTNRCQFMDGDMFADPLPVDADTILLSNVLHDWDLPECQALIERCAEALPSGGRLMIHDVFLNDALDGPLPIALYSASLFSFTEGRAYSAAEYRDWLETAGLECYEPIRPTGVHCGLMTAIKPT
ncbi:Demethylspheroidene O-methyltransferase [Rosistilla carotiformis]|uniref:Demethylspheroidene O-methyltransferase n=1 Tax=Rosistilla carotiformis TaxID=2528017 RepID=A0A518JSG2_9BACT|nr:methyltransferase [Rosistilla carotiformis]QDV68468.1 Demethylspheroidene O-methyltransferase [Rosistilla carotiformis]